MSELAHPDTVHGYTLLGTIGAGSYGTVCQAQSPGGFPAAMKFIPRSGRDVSALPDFKALEELRALTHPHLLKVFASWEDEHALVIAMELADGNLRERLDYCRAQQDPGIPGDELLLYLQQTASALDYLHEQGKVHRDVKPENLLLFLGTQPHVKVGDCGLVRDVSEPGSSRPQGTPAYMAPEAWDGWARPASDQYSLAMTYAELRQGFRPLPGTNAAQCEDAARLLEPDLSGLSEFEAGAIRRALSKLPSDRFPCCRDLVLALETALFARADSFRPKQPVKILKAERPLNSTPPCPTPSLPKPPVPSRFLHTVVCIGVVLVLVALGGWWLMTRPPPEPLPLPPHYAPEPGSAVRWGAWWNRHHARIVRDVGPAKVTLLLMVPKSGPPFYVMEDKVSNALYREYAKAEPGKAGQSWSSGGLAGAKPAGNGDGLPVLRVTRVQAAGFAAWIGGRLPRAEELDLAAGMHRRDGRDGPANGPRVAVGRRAAGPRPINEPHDDVSPEGARDLSGNGWEWTGDTLTVGGKEFAVTRGRSYTADAPLRFADLEERLQPEFTPTQDPEVASPYTGFRVVVPAGR